MRQAPRTGRASPEEDFQRALLKELRKRAEPDVFIFHVPNGGKRSATEGARFKAMGVVAGVPDLCIVIRGKAHFMELKAPNGRPSPTQIFTMRCIDDAGAPVAVVNNMADALRIFGNWCALARHGVAA